MLYLIPAWYKQNTWSENEQSWQIRRTHSEFDDTIKHVQLFQRSGAYPYRILLLGYSPNFRHFLHRQSVYHAPYWSCFDAIQEVKRKKAGLLSIHQLDWPDGVEFIFTPFVLVVMLNGEKYAQVEYGEDGNPILIDLYKSGVICRKNLYDDRGFLSATILYKNGCPFIKDYLMENGVWKLREYFSDGHIEVNQKCPQYLIVSEGQEQVVPFLKQRYETMDQVIQEVLIFYLKGTKKNDLFCAAMCELHAEVLFHALQQKKLILSFFKNRYDLQQSSKATKLLERADAIITDSVETSQILCSKTYCDHEKITNISPFDTRMDHSISQQLSVQNILLPVDDMPKERFTQIIILLKEYLLQNEKARVCLFTREAYEDKKEQLINKVTQILLEHGYESDANESEEEWEQIRNLQSGFEVEQCVEELAVSQCMKKQRVLVELRDVPELYLQIMAVSIGIPQIVLSENMYAINKRNSIVLSELEALKEALDYYLDGLAHWNEAQVQSYEIGKIYTTAVLIAKWKEVIRKIE